MSIGEKLLNLRKKKGLSQEDVASAIGVSRQTISKWETDQSLPDVDKIIPLCELYEITADSLLQGNTLSFKEETMPKKNKTTALVVSGCVALYILSLVVAIILEEMQISENIAASVFMMMAGLTSCILIYYFMSHSEPKELKEKKIENQNSQKKIINSIVWTIAFIVYFLVSFTFNIWDISWIIFIIFCVISKIIDLIWMLGGSHEE